MNFKQIEISSTFISFFLNILLLFVFLHVFNLNDRKEELVEIGFGIVGGGSGGGGTDQINSGNEALENNMVNANDEETINKKAADDKTIKSPSSQNQSSDETIKSSKNKDSKTEVGGGNKSLVKGKGGRGNNPEGTGIGNGFGPGSGNGNGSGNGEGDGIGDGYSIEFGGRVRKIYNYIVPVYPDGVSKNIDIKLRFTILPDGTVGTISPLIKADSRLENTAINSLRQWRFEPVQQGQKQQTQTAVITFPFRIR